MVVPFSRSHALCMLIVVVIAILNHASNATFVFAPYKDLGIGADWNNGIIASQVNGSATPINVVDMMPAGMDVMYWGFASGECGSEDWAGLTSAEIAANVPYWVQAQKYYVLSTGGAGATFTCSNDSHFATFIETYYSDYMVGVDFDIESGQNQSVVDNIVQRIVNIKPLYPNLRFSFTIASLATTDGSVNLNSMGTTILNSVKAHNLTDVYYNLMTMDYYDISNCQLNATGGCDMGASAIMAAQTFHDYYNISFGNIEITPMIGANDDITEITTPTDCVNISLFANRVGLGGVHYWSFDRDTDCPLGPAQGTCNSYGHAGLFGYANAFMSTLNNPSYTPTSSTPSFSSNPSPIPTSTPPSPSAVVPSVPSPHSSASRAFSGAACLLLIALSSMMHLLIL